MDKLRFGTAGIPISTPESGTVNGIKHLKTLGLEAMELEFVRRVNISEEKAPEIKEAARKNKVALTCHGQYYINLNSKEPEKIIASQQRIFNAAKIASLCGAESLTFHAAFYQGTNPEAVYQQVKQKLSEVMGKLDEEGLRIIIRPETTGKASQWGDLNEIVRLSRDLDGVLPCIDFSHLHARSAGKFNSEPEWREIFVGLESSLGRRFLDNMHVHISGIEYSPKGERWHLNLKDSDLKFQELLKVMKEFRAKGVIISESPNIEEDALLMKKTWENLE